MSEPSCAIKDRAGADLILQEIATLSAQRAGIASMKQRAIAAIELRFNPDLEQLDNRIATREKWLEQWLGDNPGEMKHGKFVDLKAGRLGFRKAKASLALISQARLPESIEQAWKDAFDICKHFFPQYLRITTTLDKESILHDATQEEPLNVEKVDDAGELRTIVPMSEALAEMGVRIQQSENFYLKLKAA